MKNSLSIILLFLSITQGFGQNTVVPLWEKGIPNWKPTDQEETQRDGDILWIEQVHNPTIAIYLPTQQHATGQGVIICPGGGYRGLAMVELQRHCHIRFKIPPAGVRVGYCPQ